MWAKHAYPSTASLAAWMTDLQQRMAFVASWLYDGVPKVFWLPGLFNPRKVLASVLQARARSLELPVDTMAFTCTATQWLTADNVSEVCVI